MLFDDYLAGRSLSNRETYLQVDPSGGRPGLRAGCRRTVTIMKWAIAQGYLGDSPPGDAIAAALPKTRHAGRTHANIDRAPPPISPHRLLLTGEFRHEAKGSSLRTFTNRAARTGQIVAYEYCPSGRRLFRVCPLKDSRFI